MMQASHTNRLTVLLANEQEGWHQTVTRLLEPQGVQTLSARSGREALQLMESTPVHVAVLDQQMPQLGRYAGHPDDAGTEQRAPGNSAGQRADQPLCSRVLGMHVFSVLSKPVDFNVLLDALARVLRRYYESRWPGSH